MTEQATKSLEGNAKPKDSWLIYLSRDLGKVCKWGKNEIDLLADSTKDAYGTTKKITKKYYSSLAVADHTGKGILFVVRATGKAARLAQSSTKCGLSEIKQALSGEKKEEEKSGQQAEAMKEESVPQKEISKKKDAAKSTRAVKAKTTTSPSTKKGTKKTSSRPSPGKKATVVRPKSTA